MKVVGSTRVLAVVGDPVAHSLSPVMHNAAIRAMNIDYVYVPFRVSPRDLEQAVHGIRALAIAGVNVTIPHKERVMGWLDEVGEDALQIGSVNTIINENGHLRGESTDGPGFLKSVEAAWGSVDGASVLILGAGGSARAVAYALAGVGCRIVVANRTVARAEALVNALNSVFRQGSAVATGLEHEMLAEHIAGTDLLVNTTSVGMHPHVDGIPIPPDLLSSRVLVYDLVYNPPMTRLVREAQSRGARTMNGLKMLVYQGALSLEMWTGRAVPVDVMEKAAEEALCALPA